MSEEQKQIQLQPSQKSLEKAKNAHDYSMNMVAQLLQQMWNIGYTSGFEDAMEIIKTDQKGQNNG